MGIFDVMSKPLEADDELLVWEDRKENFLTNLIAREAGWTIDTGGRTKFGISERAHGQDTIIRDLSIEEAKKIYRKEYLHRGEERLGRTPEAIKFMDMEVNMGYNNAMMVTQRALNELLPDNKKVTADGDYGPKTKKAISTIQENFGSQMFINSIKRQQRLYYDSLPEKDNYPGWEKRAAYDPIKED